MSDARTITTHDESEPEDSRPIDYEPFGQAGVRQLIGPAIVLISLSIATGSAIMWHRSFNIADIFLRNAAISELSVRSVYGRIVIARVDWDVNLNGVVPLVAWTYETRPVPERISDGWPDSWQRTIGIEWRNQPYSRQTGVIGGWWFRIRWRTILFLSAIPPIVHLLRQRRVARR